METLLKKGEVQELLDKYSYVEVPEDVLEEVRSEISEDEFNELEVDGNYKAIHEIQMHKAARNMFDYCTDKIILDLKAAQEMTPEINKKKTTVIFPTGLKFKKIDGNWRWNIESYMTSNPAYVPFVYCLLIIGYLFILTYPLAQTANALPKKKRKSKK